MEYLVTIRIERAITGIEGVREIRSCTKPDVSIVDVTFGPGTANATALVRNAVRALDLAEDASEPAIETLPDPSALAVIVEISGDVGQPAIEMAAHQLEVELNDTITAGSAVRITGVRRETRIELDPERARALGLHIEPASSPAARPPKTTQQEDEIVLQRQGRESVLVEVYARTRDDAPSVSEQVRSVVERLRTKSGSSMEFHVVDCSSNSPVFASVAECEDLPARTIANLFAARLVADLESVKGVTHVHSESVLGQVTTRFEIAKDYDAAAVLAQIKRIPARPGTRVSRPMPFPPTPMVRIDICGKTIDEMLPLAHRLRSDVLAVAGVARVAAPALRPPRPQLQIRVRREKAAAYGLTVQEVTDFIETALAGQAERDRIQELQDLNIPVADSFVPLQALVEVALEAVPSARFRLNGRPTITLDIAPEARQDVDLTIPNMAAIVKEARAQDPSITIELTRLTHSYDPAINTTPQPQQAE